MGAEAVRPDYSTGEVSVDSSTGEVRANRYDFLYNSQLNG